MKTLNKKQILLSTVLVLSFSSTFSTAEKVTIAALESTYTCEEAQFIQYGYYSVCSLYAITSNTPLIDRSNIHSQGNRDSSKILLVTINENTHRLLSLNAHNLIWYKLLSPILEETTTYFLYENVILSSHPLSDRAVVDCLFDILLLFTEMHFRDFAFDVTLQIPTTINIDPHSKLCYLSPLVDMFKRTFQGYSYNVGTESKEDNSFRDLYARKADVGAFLTFFREICHYPDTNVEVFSGSSCSHPLLQVLFTWLNSYSNIYTPSFFEITSLLTLLPLLSRTKREVWREYLTYRGMENAAHIDYPLVYSQDYFLHLLPLFHRLLNGIFPQVFSPSFAAATASTLAHSIPITSSTILNSESIEMKAKNNLGFNNKKELLVTRVKAGRRLFASIERKVEIGRLLMEDRWRKASLHAKQGVNTRRKVIEHNFNTFTSPAVKMNRVSSSPFLLKSPNNSPFNKRSCHFHLGDPLADREGCVAAAVPELLPSPTPNGTLPVTGHAKSKIEYPSEKRSFENNLDNSFFPFTLFQISKSEDSFSLFGSTGSSKSGSSKNAQETSDLSNFSPLQQIDREPSRRQNSGLLIEQLKGDETEDPCDAHYQATSELNATFSEPIHLSKANNILSVLEPSQIKKIKNSLSLHKTSSFIKYNNSESHTHLRDFTLSEKEHYCLNEHTAFSDKETSYLHEPETRYGPFELSDSEDSSRLLNAMDSFLLYSKLTSTKEAINPSQAVLNKIKILIPTIQDIFSDCLPLANSTTKGVVWRNFLSFLGVQSPILVSKRSFLIIKEAYKAITKSRPSQLNKAPRVHPYDMWFHFMEHVIKTRELLNAHCPKNILKKWGIISDSTYLYHQFLKLSFYEDINQMDKALQHQLNVHALTENSTIISQPAQYASMFKTLVNRGTSTLNSSTLYHQLSKASLLDKRIIHGEGDLFPSFFYGIHDLVKNVKMALLRLRSVLPSRTLTPLSESPGIFFNLETVIRWKLRNKTVREQASTVKRNEHNTKEIKLLISKILTEFLDDDILTRLFVKFYDNNIQLKTLKQGDYRSQLQRLEALALREAEALEKRFPQFSKERRNNILSALHLLHSRPYFCLARDYVKKNYSPQDLRQQERQKQQHLDYDLLLRLMTLQTDMDYPVLAGEGTLDAIRSDVKISHNDRERRVAHIEEIYCPIMSYAYKNLRIFYYLHQASYLRNKIFSFTEYDDTAILTYQMFFTHVALWQVQLKSFIDDDIPLSV